MSNQSKHSEPDPSVASSQQVQPVPSHGDKVEPVSQWPDYLPVKEAARRLGVSERSIYGYIEQQRLPFTHQGNLIVLETAAVRGFRRKAAGRPRVYYPEWHRSSIDNGQVLTHVSVAVREGQHADLEHRLEHIHINDRHRLPGTIARYIAREPGLPERVRIVLIWRKAAMPSEGERIASLAAMWDELDDLLDWEHAHIQDCEMLLHT